MPYDRKRLAEYFRKFAKGRGVTVGKKLVAELRRVLSVPAPTRITASGRLVAATPAKPFAPPRMITKKLRESVKLTETKNGCRVRVGAPYGMPLELSRRWAGFPHQFLAVAMRNLGLKPGGTR